MIGDRNMKKIGVLGLGNIAQKAYLPVITSLQDTYEWHFCTRNADKRQKLMRQYGITHGEGNVEELIAQNQLQYLFIRQQLPIIKLSKLC